MTQAERFILAYYKSALTDIMANRNLEKHRTQITNLIGFLTKKIELAKEEHDKPIGFDDLKNEFYYLLYEISERT
ncbi:hypothetical protein EXU85_20620 [Spirosoma sp. KCTC 42546]|uniref:hypothetical protein n=1 Tax=Spirosoma sp. KCTC 42546 TaxID=2520506 RepID=UPI00115AE5C0|nr:hypothetical protein [Spirosoma sp. KCTC 42546]QDK80885.1 hypothetical protein EXU85_20620 [Spirosoma sp. KCTC 42546]